MISAVDSDVATRRSDENGSVLVADVTNPAASSTASRLDCGGIRIATTSPEFVTSITAPF